MADCRQSLRRRLRTLAFDDHPVLRRLAMAGGTVAAHVIGSVAMTLLGIGSYALATRV